MQRASVPVPSTLRPIAPFLMLAVACMAGAAGVAAIAESEAGITLAAVILAVAVGALALVYLRYKRCFVAGRTRPRA